MLLVRKWPRRAVLPLRQSVSVMIRHFDLRETLGVEGLVFRDDAVFEEQIRRQGVYLVGFQRSFFSERHAAIDVIPYRRRVWRVKRHDICSSDTRCETRWLLYGGRRRVDLYQLRCLAFVS